MGCPADVQRGREHPDDLVRDPGGPARSDPPGRRRRLARRHWPDRRLAGRGGPADPRPPSAREAGTRTGLPRRLRDRAGREGGDRRPDGRRLVARSDDAPLAHRPDRRRVGRPRHRVALHAKVAASSTGASGGGSSPAAAASSPGRSCDSVRAISPAGSRRGALRRWRRSRSTGSTPAGTSSRSR